VLKSREANFMRGDRSFIRKKMHSQKKAGCAAGVQNKQGEFWMLWVYGST